MNANTITPTAPESQSLKARLDGLSIMIGTKAEQLETLADQVADILGGCPPLDVRAIGNGFNLATLAMGLAKEIVALSGQIEICGRDAGREARA